MNQQKLVVYGVVAAFVLIVAWLSLYTVRQQEQAMIVALGKVVRLVDEPGLHVKMPFYHQVVYFDKRVLNNESPSEEVQTLDKERVLVDSYTRWQILDAGTFYRNVRSIPVALQRLDMIVNSNVREAVARVSLAELVTSKRYEVMHEIQMESAHEAEQMGIKIVDVRLKRTDLPKENSEAVFRRMRAERQKEASKLRAEGEEEAQKVRAEAERERTVLLAEAQRDSRKLQGEGEGEAIRITGAAFNKDPQFYKLTRSLDAYKEAFGGSNTLMVIDAGTDFMNTMVKP
ncbi:MAG: protease modulator HflC [Alphaproteobacteria bacterium]|nr:MAG: protease modulator HflC [Alphaproteobacteria bacterium]